MFGQEEAQDFCQQVLRRCGNSRAEVLLFVEESALTRFANNHIHQNMAGQDIRLIVRVFHGKRMGTVTTNRLDAEALDELVPRAHKNAEASPEDPDYPGMPEPVSYVGVEAFDKPTAGYSPEARARAVSKVCRLASGQGLNASGAFSTGTGELAIANSQGVLAYHPHTSADFQTVVIVEDASSRSQSSSWRVEEIRVEDLGHEAIQKAVNGRGPRKIDPGEYTVVLDPYGTQDLVTMLNLHGMGAQAVLEGRSWMSDRIGNKAMSELISIWDDGLDPDGVPRPFDFEGVPKQRVDIVHNGVLEGPVYDRVTARKARKTSTGHAMPPTMRSFGPIATNLFLAPGTTTIQEMIRSTGRGLYITRFWYTRLVHPRDCVVTGMTRDGVFMIEDGILTYPVKDLRFTQSYVEALANVDTVGSQTRLLKSEYGSLVTRVPGLKINGFKFSGSTV